MHDSADILAIQQLLARYNHAIDGREAEAFAEAFTEDGVLVTHTDTYSGRDDLKRFIEEIKASGAPEFRHWVNNHEVTVDGDRATARAYLLLLRVGAEPKPALTGRYSDTLVREAVGWRFRRREFVPDGG
jgi:uncharacterized protein (TIGR02246 family)